MITVDDRPWVPVKVPDEPLNRPRSAEAYAAVLDSLPLLKSPRYQPHNGATFCNIYVWDCTRLLGCEVPHWTDRDGNKTPMGIGFEQTANDMRHWLRDRGAASGWVECRHDTAQDLANNGTPAIAVWLNSSGTGHIAMVRPGELDSEKGPCIAQAGKRNFRAGHVEDGFGTRPVEYFVHLL